MTLAANLKSAYDTIAGAGLTVYYSQQLEEDGSNLLTTAPTTYVDVGLATRGSIPDFDGEALADFRIRVRSWSKGINSVADTDEAVRAALEAAGWIPLTTTELPFDSGYWGLASDYHKYF